MDSTREHAWLDYAGRGIAHRDGLSSIERGTPRGAELRADDSDGDGGTVLFGHAAVTNAWTELADFLGPYKERVAPGAFSKTLKERGAPVVQFNHGRDMAVGSKPIGLAAVAEEDDQGLYIEADLFDDAQYVRELLPALRSGAISGMSFMFDVIRESWTWASDSESGLDERTIEEVRLYEAGPVVWPAYEQTDVGIRGALPAEVLEGLDVKARRHLSQICRTSPTVAARLAAPQRGHQSGTAARDAVANQIRHMGHLAIKHNLRNIANG